MILIFSKPSSPHAESEVLRFLQGRGRLLQTFEMTRARHGFMVESESMAAEDFRELSFVEASREVSGAWPLLAREERPLGSSVPFGNTRIGDGSFALIAGPCGVENKKQLEEVSTAVLQAGAIGIRGGAFKPRTSAYAFQGLAEEGLQLLAEAREKTGLPIVTEVMSPEDVDLVAGYADMLQVGSRNVQNFRLLEAVGRADRPVLLKRGMASTLDEYLAAAEYIFLRGNENVILCERGIRSFEPRMRNVLDLASVALLKRLTHLPVLVDPSHGTGLSELVPDLARAALAVGADGVLVEVHPEPAQALSDGRQSLRPQELIDLSRSLGPLALALGRSMATFRNTAAEAQV